MDSERKISIGKYHNMANRVIPELVSASVLRNPSCQAEAQRWVDSWIQAVSDPVIAREVGFTPPLIVDLTDETDATKLIASSIKQWTSEDILRHKVDVVKLFPKWASHTFEIPDKGITMLISPLITIDPESYFSVINETIRKLDTLGIHSRPPTYVIILPEDWINSEFKGRAGIEGRSILISAQINKQGFISFRIKDLEHEVIHAAIFRNPDLGYSGSWTLNEGIEKLLEVMISDDDIERSINSLACILREYNPYIDHIGGFSEVATYRTYRANSIERKKGDVVDKQGRIRVVSYYQGLILMHQICSQYGGFNSVIKVYKEAVNLSKSFRRLQEEQLIELAVQKGLGLSKEKLKRFKVDYLSSCDQYIKSVGVEVVGARPWKDSTRAVEENGERIKLLRGVRRTLIDLLIKKSTTLPQPIQDPP